jgi:metal-dependent amidase/aminoacylase/carboxypeptidase family protein
VVNHKEDTEFFVEVARKVPGVVELEEIEAQMGGEDFAYYLEKIPGTFFFTGAEDAAWEETYPHHHPKFKINEDALLLAANLLGAATLTYLKQNAQEKLEVTK